LLTRLIRLVVEAKDTPALIMAIAADAELIELCQYLVDPSTESTSEMANAVKYACRELNMHPGRLKEHLTPAAKALGLMPFQSAPADYYNLLGVQSEASMREIKKAFRRKAIIVHPDANTNLTGNSQRFIELNAAYRTLRDPQRRRHYDIARQLLKRWREPSTGCDATDSNTRFVLWYLCGLFCLFIALFSALNIFQ